MILIYMPCKDRKEAKRIGKKLIEEKLIACANIFPIESLYKWNGKVQDGKEAVLLCKTRDGYYGDVARRVTEMHSYDVPAIIKINAGVNKSYGDWLYKETLR